MLSTSEIVLEYVCPLLGCIAANLMFAAPFKDVRRAVSRGTLGILNPTPWAVMTGNCCGWVAYSYLIQNQFVFWANAPGFILSVWLNMAAVKLQYSDRMSTAMRSSFVQLLDSNRRSFVMRPSEQVALDSEVEKLNNEDDDKRIYNQLNATTQSFEGLRKMAFDIAVLSEAPAPHEKVVMVFVTIWVAVISLICFLNLENRQRELIVGITVNINVCLFYGAPLSTIFEVLKKSDSTSIHRRTMAMNTTNACFWTAFGLGTKDYFILVPNGIGAVLGFVQMILCVVIPSEERRQLEEAGVVTDLELSAGGMNDVDNVGLGSSCPTASSKSQ
eukprot:g5036.t1 g5036   contig18:494635-495818(+)